MDYPEGKGKIVRFREGSLIRYNAEFRNSYIRTIQAVYLLCGGFLFWFPASVTFRLPTGVAESVPPERGQHTQTLWTMGNANDLTSPMPAP